MPDVPIRQKSRRAFEMRRQLVSLLPLAVALAAVVPGAVRAVDLSVPAPDLLRPVDGTVLEADSGTTTLRLNDLLLRDYGARLVGEVGKRDADGFRPVRAPFAGALAFTPEGAGIKGFHEGRAEVRWPASLVRADGATFALGPLRLVPGKGDVLLRALDREGEPVFEFATVHHKLHGAVRVQLQNGDIRIAPKLARWLGMPEVSGVTVGQFDLDATVRAPEGFSTLDPKSCAFVYWPESTKPGIGKVEVRTLLIRLGDSAGGSLAAQCQSGCNGTNQSRNVKITPGATIANDTDPLAAHVPWYPMFSSAARAGWPQQNPPPTSGQPNYPYQTLDQHPMLVWSVYRINKDGQIEQLGRSGVKHAFFTINRNCLPGCNVNGNILGPGCDDIYSIGNNDANSVLGVRREIDPVVGRWGRCNSTFDSNCDGLQDRDAENNLIGGASGNFDRRLMAVEADLSPTLNPSAQYFIESWYIVRDQKNPFTAMGSQQFTPTFTTAWTVPVVTSGPGAFRQGATIDRWVDPANPGPDASTTLIETATGRFKVAVRVTALPSGRYRYDYAVFNADFARVITPSSGPGSAEPNLCVASNSGFAGFRVPLAPNADPSNPTHFDNGLPASDDWTPTLGAEAVSWAAPAGGPVTRCGLTFEQPGNTLDFGTLFRFSFESAAPPESGQVELIPATGDPTPITASALVPGLIDPDRLFRNGFE
jgi:hypothetical protein